MLNERLAVCLIGQYRTWPICAAYLQTFFASKVSHVDYFFVTWDKNSTYKDGFWSTANVPVTEQDVLQHFDTPNVTCKILPDIKRYNTYYRMALLAKEVNALKLQKEQEGNFVYDSVVETRPDLFIANDNLPWKSCIDNVYYGGSIQTVNGQLFVSDTYIRSSSATHNIISNRIEKFVPGKGQGNYHHKMLATYLVDNNISWAGHDFNFQTAIRNPECATVNLNESTMDEIVAKNPRHY